MTFPRCTIIPVALFLILQGATRGAAATHTQDENVVDEDDLEKLLLSIPDPQRLRSILFDLTQKSHVAGTKGDWDSAYYVRDKLLELGYQDAHIEAVPVMMTYPLDRPKLNTSFGFHAKLSEDAIPQDVTSGTTPWRNHTFLAYSPTGRVTARLVYANYGRPEDFDALEKYGVPVANNIVIMRYGECFRGLKIMNAEARGAIGSIIFSDPQQDGYGQGPTYPNGPWRPPSSVQRGSVFFNSICSGDPWRLYLLDDDDNEENEDYDNIGSATATTTSSTTRTTVKDVCGYDTTDLIPKHPAIPISYEDAQPLLVHLNGGIAPDDWQGELPFQYTMGPSEFQVTISTNNTFVPRKIPNVIATLYADGDDNDNSNATSLESIVLGNHRDAWVFGAVDPNSGTTALLEVARALSILKKSTGWKPRRNIVLASWSGEEYGLLGSTAYAELKAKANLNEDVIAYLNVDCAVRGNASLQVLATHSLTTLFQQAAQQVPAPLAINANKTMADNTVWRDQAVGTLGSGSDYSAFLDRFGIASLDMSYQGSYGVYHSVYDSFSWMEQQGDPTFEIHQAMTRLWALMAFRLASLPVLPIYMTPQADQMKKDIGALKQSMVAQFGNQTNMTELEHAAQLFLDSATAIDKERELYEKKHMLVDTENEAVAAAAGLNRRLMLTERLFLGPGLPKRPWFRHLLQAPGYYLGYGGQAFPGIAQGLLENNVTMAQSELTIAAAAVSNAAMFLTTKQQQQPQQRDGAIDTEEKQ